eukprot:1538334-Amphidinium_carterae.1
MSSPGSLRFELHAIVRLVRQPPGDQVLLDDRAQSNSGPWFWLNPISRGLQQTTVQEPVICQCRECQTHQKLLGKVNGFDDAPFMCISHVRPTEQLRAEDSHLHECTE